VRGGSKRTVVVVCGPTASGKSALADLLSAEASALLGGWVTTVLVDSMQVYREVPRITNQARERPAELSGVVSVAEKWNVARHRDAALSIASRVPADLPLLLDAGSGMYLNAIVFDLPLAPKVPPEVRAAAERIVGGGGAAPPTGAGDYDPANPRRRARAVELALAGAPERGSVWSAPLRFEATFVYLRPPRAVLDASIARRSARIAREGLGEAAALAEAMDASRLAPNPSVREAVGIKEMLLLARGAWGEAEAAEAIARRTRRLARRQTRWFDKLARVVPGAPERFLVLEEPGARGAEAALKRLHATIAP